jgi:hypothetical protein
MRRLSVLSLLALSSCVVRSGPRAERYDPATRAAGTGTTITTAASQIAGELLEVRDTALVVLTSSRVTLIPNRVITAMYFVDLPRFHTGSLTSDETRRLRLLSRFPYGMPDQALTQLMSSRRQDTLEVLDK